MRLRKLKYYHLRNTFIEVFLMEHLHVCLIDAAKIYSGKLAKKSGETDYLMSNHKEGEKVLCTYEPHRYPEKLQSLLGALTSSDFIVWSVDKIDADFGEVALALWLANKPGILVLSPSISEDQLAPILSKSPMWKWEKMSSPDPNELRLKLFSIQLPPSQTIKRAVVDSCFPVGGVGTVALTKVEGGTFNVHDELEVVPGMVKTSIRSIQEQDKDEKSTSPLSRAGFALKNIQPEQVKRGSYLAPPGTVSQFEKGKAKIFISPLIKDLIEQSNELFFAFGLQFISGRLKIETPISSKDGEKEVEFYLTSTGAACVGDSFFIIRPNKRPKIIGAGKFTELQK